MITDVPKMLVYSQDVRYLRFIRKTRTCEWMAEFGRYIRAETSPLLVCSKTNSLHIALRWKTSTYLLSNTVAVWFKLFYCVQMSSKSFNTRKSGLLISSTMAIKRVAPLRFVVLRQTIFSLRTTPIHDHNWKTQWNIGLCPKLFKAFKTKAIFWYTSVTVLYASAPYLWEDFRKTWW